MAATTATTTTVAVLRDWRGWPAMLGLLWRRSLRFRTLSITLIATSLAILITCVTMALVIQNDLFISRKNVALEDARRAVDQVQATLDVAEVGDDPAALTELWNGVQSTLARTSSTDQLAGYPIDNDSDGIRLNGFEARLSADLLSPELRARVVELADRQQWQSIALPAEDGGETPGIVVGQQLLVPEAGAFEIYFAYDLGDADQTLVFVQRTLWIAGIGLVAIVAAISWIVLRAVSAPIVQAAETSARLAAGDLGVRLEVHGEDELATLGRSFNAMADSIEAQIKELGELSMVQQRFVSDVSHELRTPLTTIRLAADMLNDQRGEFDPTTARTAELLHAQVQRFETLLSDLLEISRYDAGSVQLELEATSLAHLAEDIIEQMRPLAETRGTELRLVAPGGYSPVDMDPRRVRRVLRNLIGNAIEHGEGRPVVITVDSNQHAVAAGVRDFGLGMQPADVERVFDRFWRADPSRQRTIGGTGLGLSIALGDATLHGGTLAVWSEFGVGTNFVLTIPRRDGVLDGPSPIPIEPQEPLAEIGDATQPISLTDAPAGLFDDEEERS
ncbi:MULTISPECIES: MtrAB system histidine kinase MtrB [Microbacterium]|uniref:Sensor histidine kinase MtrB n=1 Tax=Microbacterium algeriense TaxID=2615184 RepID=A0ABQ6V4H2_9MICO|nr:MULTISPECIES: MtrAB system histidine kinase MtrB [Microbacterium]AZH78139.1 two-component sensor histidine kinase [Microbacterium sp. Y-01]KAB1864268.1 HAMP domain-containing histidine kinase [Microbacterium algeriense]MDX2398446.1 MtrAB system histidine kinase MtrB [Microbacterium algeriense]